MRYLSPPLSFGGLGALVHLSQKSLMEHACPSLKSTCGSPPAKKRHQGTRRQLVSSHGQSSQCHSAFFLSCKLQRQGHHPLHGLIICTAIQSDLPRGRFLPPNGSANIKSADSNLVDGNCPDNAELPKNTDHPI